jgi:hypothetical protein
MLHGATLKIFPNWTPQEEFVDFSWNDAELAGSSDAGGDWAGQLALLAGTGSTLGKWNWGNVTDPDRILTLMVENVGTPPHLFFLADLFSFSLPLTTGMTGTGKLKHTPPGVGPGANLSFTWKAFVTS